MKKSKPAVIVRRTDESDIVIKGLQPAEVIGGCNACLDRSEVFDVSLRSMGFRVCCECAERLSRGLAEILEESPDAP